MASLRYFRTLSGQIPWRLSLSIPEYYSSTYFRLCPFNASKGLQVDAFGSLFELMAVSSVVIGVSGVYRRNVCIKQ